MQGKDRGATGMEEAAGVVRKPPLLPQLVNAPWARYLVKSLTSRLTVMLSALLLIPRLRPLSFPRVPGNSDCATAPLFPQAK